MINIEAGMYIDLLSSVHKATKRDYLGRVNAFPKEQAAEKAVLWGYDYWDGSRDTGYGGYRYDGRWQPVAKALAEHYQLRSGQKVLDVGCGKGFILYDLTQVVPGLEVVGLDVSAYALEHAHAGVKAKLVLGHAQQLPFADRSFDLVISINTLHNLRNFELDAALREIERVGKQKYICVESFRNEKEKVNLLYWQLTCRAFCGPDEWAWWFRQTGYTGDHSFIYFE